MAVAMVMRVMVDREHEAESVSNLRPRRNLRPRSGDGGSQVSAGQRFALGFFAEGQQQEADHERDRRERDGRADGSVGLHA
jgi:hypothetical protein